MITLRRSSDRGYFDHGWLETYHTFSFGRYVDRNHVRFRSLRVMNEDRIAPGQGFGEHPHDNMEIVTYVLSGELEHRDSLGHGEVLRPGEFQRMTAGTGIRHSEFNPSTTEPVHLYQIWLLPEREGLEPGYEQRSFPDDDRLNRLRLVASRQGTEGSLTIHTDARIFLCSLQAGRSVRYSLEPGRHAWLQAMRGSLELDGVRLDTGDGAAVSEERDLTAAALEDAEFLLFDLA